MADVHTNIDFFDQFNTIAQPSYDKIIRSTMMRRSPTLALFLNRMVRDGWFGTPGAWGNVGGQLMTENEVQRENMANDKYNFTIHTANQGGARVLGAFGQRPTVERTQLIKSAELRHMAMEAPMKVWRHQYMAATTNTAVHNLAELVLNDAHMGLDQLTISQLWSGYPTDQTDEEWDGWIGLRPTLDDGNTYVHYGTRDRTTLTAVDSLGNTTYPLKPAKFVTAQTAFSFSLLDDVDEVTNGMTNLVIVNPTVFKKVKQLCDQKSSVARVVPPNGPVPDYGITSFKWDYVEYGRKRIIGDPYCPAGESEGDSIMVVLNLEDWFIHIDPRMAWKVKPLEEGRPGEDDAYQGSIRVRGRLGCHRIDQQAVWTNVS